MKMNNQVLPLCLLTILFCGCSTDNIKIDPLTTNTNNSSSSASTNNQEPEEYNHDLKKYFSEKIQCGSSTFYFESTCYDELDGLSDRGSSGGIRDYCKDISLHVLGENFNKEIPYPMLPKYLIKQINSHGYTFKDMVEDVDITPEVFGCLTTQTNKNYLLINYRTAGDIRDLDRKSVVLNENGEYLNKKESDYINNLISPTNVLLVESTNVIYLGK